MKQRLLSGLHKHSNSSSEEGSCAASWAGPTTFNFEAFRESFNAQRVPRVFGDVRSTQSISKKVSSRLPGLNSQINDVR